MSVRPRLEGPLAAVLEAHRALFNAQFRAARAANPRLDGEAFSQVLVEAVQPLVLAIAQRDATKTEEAAKILYELALTLTARDWLGAAPRSPYVPWLWSQALPWLADLVAASPRVVVASLSNAVVRLAGEPGFPLHTWLDALLAAAPLCEGRPALLLQAGQVLAWRCGMAVWRESAIAVWRALPPRLQAHLLPDGEAMLAERWAGPVGIRQVKVVARAGGFVGFGGAFSQPPEVMALDGQLWVLADSLAWTLHADAFGAQVRRQGTDLPSGAPDDNPSIKLQKDGTIRWGKASVTVPMLAGASSSAATQDTLAVTLPHSHFIFLVALTTQPALPATPGAA